MSDRVAFLEGRALPRLALTGLAVLWLAGCSADVSRFDMSSNPFSNPFSAQTASASAPGAAPAGNVASAPLAPPTPVASAPIAAAQPAAVASAAQTASGAARGWTAAGGTPVTVAQGETLDTLSRRYGVPASALLAANGLSRASEVHGGMNIVVPVYNAGSGHAVASAEREDKSAKKKLDVAERDAKSGEKARLAKGEEKRAEKDKLAEREKAKGKAESKTVAEASPVKPEAKSGGAKGEQQVASANPKKPAIDDTPTGNVDPKAGAKSQQADASGGAPEFRWPARGRIIEGFKPGANDGIDISVPAGTSVRAAENGVVVYSGDGLKGYGNLVLIKHPNGFVTAYANNGELDVKRGETVKRGQVIAKSGDSGNVNSPQLHFELRKGSTPVDPTQYLAGL